MAGQFDGIGFCCCNPCDRHELNFEADGVFTASPLTVSDTTGWSVTGGKLVLTNAAGDTLTWSVPHEAKSTPFYLEVAFDIDDVSDDSGGIFLYVGAKLISLFKSNGGDSVLTYGTITRNLGAWTGGGTRCTLRITPSECGTWIWWEINAGSTGILRTFEISLADFGAPDSSFSMGVIGLAAGGDCESSPCCPDQCRADPLAIDQTFTVNGMTVHVSGTLNYDSGEGAWIGDLTWTVSGGDCLFNPVGPYTWSDVRIECTGDEADEYSLSGADVLSGPHAAASGTCNPFVVNFNAVQSPVLCDATTANLNLQFTGTIPAGDPSNTFDNARFVACGTLPTGDECDGLGVNACGPSPRPPDEPTVSDVYKIEETGGYLVGGTGNFSSSCVPAVISNVDQACWFEYELADSTAACQSGRYIEDGAFTYRAYTVYDAGPDEIVFRVFRVGGTGSYEYRIDSADFATGFTSAFTATGVGGAVGTLTLTPKRFGEE